MDMDRSVDIPPPIAPARAALWPSGSRLLPLARLRPPVALLLPLLLLLLPLWAASPARAGGSDGSEQKAAESGAAADAHESGAADAHESAGVPVPVTLPSEEPSDVQSRIYIPSRPDSVWRILTDYDHLREYVPSLVESRLLEDHGNVKLIEQVGEGHWFFVGKKARVVLEVEEHKYSRLDFHVVDGDFNVFDGSWQLTPRGRGTLVSYRLSVKPKFFAPTFIVKKVLSHDIPSRLISLRDRVLNETAILAGTGAPNPAMGASK